MKNKERNSNYELMRIVSMFMIVLYHFLVHGHVLNNTTGVLNILVNALTILTVVHVNSFILVTGYFQCRSSFKMSKLIKLNNIAWFYKALIAIILCVFGILSLTKVDLIRFLLPIHYDTYWYIGLFMMLYCISPVLNKIIENSSKKDFRRIIISLFVILSMLPSMSLQMTFNNHRGFSLGNFILLYFIGAYFRNYPIKNSYLFKKLSKEARSLVFLIIFFILAFINLLLFVFETHLIQLGGLTSYIGSVLENMIYAYDSPIVILQAVCFFLWFGNINIKSKFINFVATLTLGVYLIHDNYLLHDVLYPKLGLRNGELITSVSIFGKLLLYSLAVFIICAVIEFIRLSIFNFIYKRKISTKIRHKYRDYVKSLGLEINW